ncbi:MAG: hypothetical protein ACREBC_36540, partial [Pyrinomonadaceae bacterium]
PSASPSPAPASSPPLGISTSRAGPLLPRVWTRDLSVPAMSQALPTMPQAAPTLPAPVRASSAGARSQSGSVRTTPREDRTLYRPVRLIAADESPLCARETVSETGVL